MDNMSHFVETLQDLILEKNIKLVDLHNASKISLTVIYDWLKKASIPTLKSLVFLSEYFACSIDYLTGRTENKYYTIAHEPQNFPVRLRLLLNRDKISIRKIAAETQIAKSAISYFLNGSVEPLLDNLVKLATFFDCSIDYLVGREN